VFPYTDLSHSSSLNHVVPLPVADGYHCPTLPHAAQSVHSRSKVTGNAPIIIQNLKKYLERRFFLKDLGRLKYFLGIEVARSKAGRLIYLNVTRLDIVYFVHVLSKFMQSPRTSHMDVAFRMLRYLKGSDGKDWAFRSTSPISWKTKKQDVVACSSAEAD
ncbi:reverse transcriptase, RNA-dependent DNA polymerase, partial [Tanacetum coccineum]